LLKVLFMGTPEFAAQSLKAILSAGYPVVGVVTQPDKPVGRGGKLQPSAVKLLALEHGLPLFQPRRVRRPEVIAQLRELGSEITVVAAFGQILSKDALEISPLGSFNVHGSLLPRWRGAAPIQRAIMAGDAKTGITTMYMDEGMDTGDMCLTGATPIGPDDTFGTVHDRLAQIGADLIVQTLRLVAAGTAPRTPQPAEGVSSAPKIDRTDEIIDWTQPAQAVLCKIRALDPFPVAYTQGPKGSLKICKAVLWVDPVDSPTATPGTVVRLIKRQGFLVAAGDGAVLVQQVQPPGKGRMDAQAYVNGGGVFVGAQLGPS